MPPDGGRGKLGHNPCIIFGGSLLNILLKSSLDGIFGVLHEYPCAFPRFQVVQIIPFRLKVELPSLSKQRYKKI